MSTINTNPINVNYPVPGVNNNSQGFRDNFASIVTNLNTAATELTDLQNKVVVKQALVGTVVNNDMANTLISNASTLGFRATTYNLGNSLAGTVLVNASIADVHYGTVSANTTINFGSWPPTGTQSNVQVRLSIAPNTSPVITFSANLIVSNNTGATTLENFVSNGGLVTVTAPAGVSEMDYIISTTDCGNTLYIEPINRPRQSTQIQQRLITPTGFQGDVNGDVAVGQSFNQLNITSTNAADYFSTTDTTQLYTDLPIVFTGTSFEANITSGTTYYVRNISANTYFTVSSTIGGANVNLAGGTGTMFANPVGYVYIATDSYNSVAYQKNVLATNGANLTVTNTTVTSNVITTGSTSSLVANLPVRFNGTVFGNITANTTYYVRNVVDSSTFTVSESLGGANLELTTASGTMYVVPQIVTLNNTSSLTVNSPIIFDANIGGLYSNTVYYVKLISSPNIAVSQSRTNGVADTPVILSSNSTGTTANIYVGNDIWKRIPLTSW